MCLQCINWGERIGQGWWRYPLQKNGLTSYHVRNKILNMCSCMYLVKVCVLSSECVNHHKVNGSVFRYRFIHCGRFPGEYCSLKIMVPIQKIEVTIMKFWQAVKRSTRRRPFQYLSLFGNVSFWRKSYTTCNNILTFFWENYKKSIWNAKFRHSTIKCRNCTKAKGTNTMCLWIFVYGT